MALILARGGGYRKGVSTKRIGEFLVDKKVLTPPQVEQVLDYGRRNKLRFGEAAIEMGLLSEAKLISVFGKNYRVDFFHLDARYFPKRTADIVGIDTILKYGVLPLGFKAEYSLFSKGTILNLGLLDPGDKQAIQAAENEARKSFQFTRTKVFLILADQFLDVVQSTYGLSAVEIAQRSEEDVDRTLSLFVHERT